MKQFLCLFAATGGLALSAAHAASVIETYTYGVGVGIPDGPSSGLANSQTIAGSAITSIEDISVSLDISGNWNGDIYATLQHSSGLAVLLNRVGRTGANAFGFGDAGFNITLNDLSGALDVHGQTSGGGLLSGTFGSDGRLVDPDSVVDTDSQTALLTTFLGGDANGDWVLFVADLSGGSSHTINQWSMEITGIPEPGTVSLLLVGAALLIRRKR